jgi:phosphatidylglycerophosphate synthase
MGQICDANKFKKIKLITMITCCYISCYYAILFELSLKQRMKNILQAMPWQKLTLFALFLLTHFALFNNALCPRKCTGGTGLLFGNDKLESGKMVLVSGCSLLQSTIENLPDGPQKKIEKSQLRYLASRPRIEPGTSQM